MMANEEHVRMLKQGTQAWNNWRLGNPHINPDLSDYDLTETLEVATHSDSPLSRRRFKLDRANLQGANLFSVDLSMASLSEANLIGANLTGAALVGAILYGADLERAVLYGANLVNAVLDRASLREADLQLATFGSTMFWRSDDGHGIHSGLGTTLNHTDLTNAIFGSTLISDVDLSKSNGLEHVKHMGPSSIDLDTIHRSGGNIPESFLRGVGLADSLVSLVQSLVGKRIEFSSCYISYSSEDEEFAQTVYSDLQNNGVRCWFRSEDLKIGAPIRTTTDQSIQQHDKLLLVLSEHSINSDQVEQEVETALERERKHGKTMLSPIRLDDAVTDIDTGWPALIRNTRNIGDFTRWQDHDAYQAAFERLLRDLKAEGG